MDPIDIRPLTASDAEIFSALRLAVAADGELPMGCTYAEEAARPMAVFRQQLSSPFGVTFGAFSGGELVGTASVLRSADSVVTVHKATLWGVLVAPSHRKRSIGRRLVEAAIRYARLTGVRRLNLTVFLPNDTARGLYESLGFVVFGVEPQAIHMGGCDHDALIMSLATEALKE